MRRAIAVVLALLVVAPLSVQAQSGGWSAPRRMKTPTKSNWFPSLTVDPWGTVHLVWSSGRGEGEEADDLLMYAAARDGEWRAGNDILLTGHGGWAARNSLAVDQHGRLQLVVRNRDAIYYTAADADQAWSARAWAPLRRLSGLSQPYYAALAVDAAGTLHVAWEELRQKSAEEDCGGCSDMWYRQSTDGGQTWSAPVNPAPSTAGAIKPQFVLGPNGAVTLAWDEGKDPNAIVGQPIGYTLVQSLDGGRSWQKPVRQSLPGDAAQQVTPAVDGAGTTLLVFRATATSRIVFRTLGRGLDTWSEPAPLPDLVARDINETPWDRYSMATDSAGNVHLLAVGRAVESQPKPALYHVVWSSADQAWQAPELLSDADYPEWPQLVVAQGNEIHAAWFTRSARDLHNSDGGSYQIWYSTRAVDAPRVAAALPAAPTPLPTATPVPIQPTSVPSAALPLSQRSAPVPSADRTEYPLLRLLGLTLLPAIGVCGVTIVAVLRRRVV